MKVYWIRHGEAEGNLYRRCHGQYNSLITENGKEQLKALRKRFDDVKIDAIYSSDLYRAWATANALAESRGLVVTTHSGLREIELGPWEDVTWIETHSSWSEEGAAFSLRPWEFVLDGAETVNDIVKRGINALTEIISRHKTDDTIAIVSHGMITRAMMTCISGLDLTEMNVLSHGDNTSVSIINYEKNKLTVESYADNSHLGELSTLARQNWWRKDSNMTDYGFWFRAPNFETETNRIEAYRRDAWLGIYGDLGNYNSELFLNEARRQHSLHPEAVVFAMDNDMTAGILQLDIEVNLKPNSGHVSFCYLEPQYREKGLGVQLLGHAVSLYRNLGRSHVVLRVAEMNEHALYFYKKYGFVQFGKEDGYKCPLLLLALDISIPPMNPSKQWA
jgi:probable phosphoglycerate mutase